MHDQTHTASIGIIGAIIAVLVCCGAPLLVAAISATGLAAWLAYSGYVLLPAVLLCIGLGAFVFYHFRTRAK